MQKTLNGGLPSQPAQLRRRHSKFGWSPLPRALGHPPLADEHVRAVVAEEDTGT